MAVDAHDRDPAVRVILLRAEGPAFCAGYGLDWSTQMQAEEADALDGRVWDSVIDHREMSRFVDTYMAATMAGCGPPLNGGAQAAMRFTPATRAVTIDMWAEATMG